MWRGKYRNILICSVCPNICGANCPVFLAKNTETVSPSGKARVAYLYLKKKILDVTNSVNLFYLCTECSACQIICPLNISLGEELRKIKEELGENNLVPFYLKQVKEITEKMNLFGMEYSEKYAGEKEGKPEVLLYIGCSASRFRGKTVEAVINFLRKTKTGFMTSPVHEKCCGLPLLQAGFKKEFIEIGKVNVEEINNLEVKEIITLCPSCTYTFKEIYPKYGLKIKKRIKHITSFLIELVNKGKIKSGKYREKERVVYHDPCILARQLNIVNEPRFLLRKTGVKILSPPHKGKETFCCGSGGLLRFSNPKIAEEIAKKRLKDLLSTKPEVIVSACPTCEETLQKQLNQIEWKGRVQVRDIMEHIHETVTIGN